jgi:hypothetical protein
MRSIFHRSQHIVIFSTDQLFSSPTHHDFHRLTLVPHRFNMLPIHWLCFSPIVQAGSPSHLLTSAAIIFRCDCFCLQDYDHVRLRLIVALLPSADSYCICCSASMNITISSLLLCFHRILHSASVECF